MSIAAIVPYYHGRACMVVGSRRHVYDVGRLLCLVHGSEGCEACAALPPARRGVLHYRREVTSGDVDGLVEAILADARDLGVTMIVVEAPRGTGPEAVRARDIAGALARRGAIPVDLPAGAPRLDIEARAVHVLRESGGAVEPLEPIEHVEAKAVEVRPAAPTMPCPPDIIAATPAIDGPRLAGIDPGSHWTAVVILDAAGAFVAAHTFEVGRVVALPKPRVAKGTTRQITHKRVIDDTDMESLLGSIGDYLISYGVTMVAVERANFFHAGSESDGARAAGLARAQWVGGEIAGALRAEPTADHDGCRWRVKTYTSRQWRALLERRGPWQQGLREHIPNLPSGEHVADAAGVGLMLLPAPARPPRAPRAHGDRRASAAASRAAKRAAAGCVCASMPHGRTCPVAVAAHKKKSIAMMGNRNAKKVNDEK